VDIEDLYLQKLQAEGEKLAVEAMVTKLQTQIEGLAAQMDDQSEITPSKLPAESPTNGGRDSSPSEMSSGVTSPDAQSLEGPAIEELHPHANLIGQLQVPVSFCRHFPGQFILYLG
jgi:hypothetical protein